MVKVIFYLKARSYKQYLAVVPFPSRSHSPDIGRKVNRPSHWCIQIWSLSPARNVSKNESKVPDFGQMKCEMVLYLLRFWPSLWLEMVSSTFTWPGTIILNVCVHVLIYFVILPWWRTTPEEVGTARRNFWRRNFCYSCARFLIHKTWHLLIVISSILFVVRLTLLLTKLVRFTRSFF